LFRASKPLFSRSSRTPWAAPFFNGQGNEPIVIKISIDAMGGDHGPATILPGLAVIAERREDVRFLVFGQKDKVMPVLNGLPKLAAIVEFTHCDIAVSMEDRPSQALRQGRWKSSMWKAVEAVKTGQAEACVSAGNTGALMAMSKFCLRTMAHIERPAIAAIWPTLRGESVVLDVGATIGADAHQLIDFAILGAAMARSLSQNERPTVGLLNVGVEEIKGQEEVKEAGQMLRQADMASMSYHGFVEGNDIGNGTVDVVVTEGFAGNIALKTAEGTARQIATYLREAMSRTLMAKVGYVFAKGAFDFLREKMDPGRANGGVFLGLNGLVVKSHGGADAASFAAAIDLAYDMVRNRLLDRIEADLDLFHARYSQAIAMRPGGADRKEKVEVQEQDTPL
jgi:glycerol-3-phosphate acyltransferase PlsX